MIIMKKMLYIINSDKYKYKYKCKDGKRDKNKFGRGMEDKDGDRYKRMKFV